MTSRTISFSLTTPGEKGKRASPTKNEPQPSCSGTNSPQQQQNNFGGSFGSLSSGGGGQWQRMIIRGNHATPLASTPSSSSTASVATIVQMTPVSTPAPGASSGVGGGGMTTQQSLPSMSWQLGTGMQSPVRIRSMHGQNFSVDSATYREMLERRKSFRCRGSLVSVRLRDTTFDLRLCIFSLLFSNNFTV